jgi:hypothetical protein
MHTSFDTSHIGVGPRVFETCSTALRGIQNVSFFVLAYHLANQAASPQKPHLSTTGRL